MSDPTSVPHSDVSLCRCAECLHEVPESEVMRFGEVPVCAECKPTAVTKLACGKSLGRFWREGRLLVVRRTEDAIEFPERCVHCDAEVSEHLMERTLRLVPKAWIWATSVCVLPLVAVPFVIPMMVWLWSPTVALPNLSNALFVMAPFPVLFVVMVVWLSFRWRTKWTYVLCETHWHEHRRRVRSDRIGNIVSAIAGTVLMGSMWFKPWATVAVIAVVLGWSAITIFFERRIGVRRYTAQHLYFQGCGHAFLEKFPEWPGKR